MSFRPASAAPPESALVAAWFAAPRSGLRLEDGRPLRVIFPGVPGGGAGPDIRDAILEAGGDYLKGDVEVHLTAGGWRAHGHHRDPAYGRVVLHVAGANGTPATSTLHGAARHIPILVLAPPATGKLPFPQSFTPPCAFEAAAGRDLATPLAALARRRLRMKAARVEPAVTVAGPGPALYAAILETVAGPANREAFASLAAALPLPALLDRAGHAPPRVDRALAIAAELRPHLDRLPLRRSGLRPVARPERRIDAAARLIATLWPAGAPPSWPGSLSPAAKLPRALQAPGIGRGLAIELSINAVLPIALAGRQWPGPAVESAWASLPSPGTYGLLRPLEGWLAHAGPRPFRTAAHLQAGLLLHRDYCSKGACGRCPLSS